MGAFNLFFVTGVALCASGRNKRKLNSACLHAYSIVIATATFIWGFVAMLIISPGVIEMWEALVSFLMVGVLVIVGYAVDYSQEPLNKLVPASASQLSKVSRLSQKRKEGAIEQNWLDVHEARAMLKYIADCHSTIEVLNVA